MRGRWQGTSDFTRSLEQGSRADTAPPPSPSSWSQDSGGIGHHVWYLAGCIRGHGCVDAAFHGRRQQASGADHVSSLVLPYSRCPDAFHLTLCLQQSRHTSQPINAIAAKSTVKPTTALRPVSFRSSSLHARLYARHHTHTHT